MKIVTDESTYIIPIIDNKNIIVTNGYKDDLINCMYTYFVSKKKTKCIIYDDDGQTINMNEISFIYIPKDISLDNNLELKAKTIMNNEISEIIKNNPEQFLSIDNIRKDLHELESDKGMIKIRKILSKGLNQMINIEQKEMNVNSLLQMLSITN